MKRFKVFTGLMVLLAIFFTACGSNTGTGGNPSTNYSLSGLNFFLLNETSLTVSETSLKGAGALVFTDPRLKDDSNYQLEFTLANQGSLKLVSNAENDLSKGVGVIFSREGNRLKVVLDGADISEAFTEVDASQKITMLVDVHAHGHAVFWPNGGAEIEEAFDARPKAKRWGLVLTGAEVLKVGVSDALDVH